MRPKLKLTWGVERGRLDEAKDSLWKRKTQLGFKFESGFLASALPRGRRAAKVRNGLSPRVARASL